jgi:hypothetical protein
VFSAVISLLAELKMYSASEVAMYIKLPFAESEFTIVDLL